MVYKGGMSFMSDTNIEILESENMVANNSFISLPMNFVPVGTVEHDSIQVYIKQGVYKWIEKFAKEEKSKEVDHMYYTLYHTALWNIEEYIAVEKRYTYFPDSFGLQRLLLRPENAALL